MEIESIEISNVKGISKKKFDVNLIPNKPNILVAPNGFGKSSFAIAFDSLKSNKLELDEKNYYLNDKDNQPEIKIVTKINGTNNYLTAGSRQNHIKNVFDVFVINNQVVAKATKMNISGNVIAKSSMEIEQTTYINTIPAKNEFQYSYSKIKGEFGENGKILPNIQSLLNCMNVMIEIGRDIEFNKFSQVKNSNLISTFKAEVNTQNGTTENIKEWIRISKIPDLIKCDELKKLQAIILNSNIENINDEVESYLASLIIVYINQNMGTSFKKVIEWYEYKKEKEFLENTLAFFDRTRFSVKPKEDKKNRLIIEWPKAHEISNGERDILTFVVLFYKAMRTFKKENCILIIDEIFDYLDDANLIAFQYLIIKLIEDFKCQKRNVFPILLTHLDPVYFKHFCFNKHKIKVHNLLGNKANPNSNFLKIVKNERKSFN